MRRARTHAVALFVAGLAALAVPSRARGEDRLASIQATLDEGEAPTTRWWALWSAGFAASTLGNGVASFAFGPGAERESARVQTVTSAIALVTTLPMPMPCRTAGARLRALRGDARANEREAERLLDECADAEPLQTGWLAQAGSLAVNAAAGAWLAFRDGYRGYGLLTFLSGELVGEVKILTAPRGALRARDAYGEVDAAVRVSMTLAPVRGGCLWGVAGTF